MMSSSPAALSSSISGFSPQALARPLALAVVLSGVILIARAWRTPFLARIGLRNALRRRLRSGLIVSGLMLATMFVASALTLDDTIARAIQNVAVFSLGRVDEEVAGGQGPLGLFDQASTDAARKVVQADGRVSGVAPAIALPNLLLEDENTRQVRGDVLGVAVDPATAGPLADLRAVADNHSLAITALGDRQLYINQDTAKLLNAHTGDTLAVFSSAWPGQRYRFVVLDVVSGGPLAVRPSLLLSLPSLQQLLNIPSQINRVYVANAGDGLSGVGYSQAIAAELRAVLPPALRVSTVKADGVAFAVQAQDVFGRILALYTLFALAIGLLLIFLIFALLAAERRTELGMARAAGMHRSEVIWMLLFEGAAYDVAAAAPGLLAGLALGILTVALVSPTVAQLGLPLQLDIEPGSVVVAFCLGLLFTLATIVLAVGAVSRFTVAAALRGLPEPPPPAPPLHQLLARAFASLRPPSDPRRAARAWSLLAWALSARGPVPLVAGIWLLNHFVTAQSVLLMSLAVSLVVAGVGLLLRALFLALVTGRLRRALGDGALARAARLRRRTDRITALGIGVALALYWSLPFDTLQHIGLPRAGGGITDFFAASVMMVFGAVLALAPNLDVLLAPFQWLSHRLGRPRHVAYIALVYPSQQRFRTAVGLAMFSLVCFTMVVMACIAASTTQRYANFTAQSGGYDVIGQPLFKPAGGVAAVAAALQQAGPSRSRDVAAIASAAPLPLIMIQPAARAARWAVYPAAAIGGAFLDGTGLPLVARSPEFASDADVWRALRDQPGTAVIDVGALSPGDLAALGLDAPAPVGIQQFVAPPIASGLLGFSALESLVGRTAALDAQNRIPRDVRDILTHPSLLAQYTLQLQGVATRPGQIAPTIMWIADPRGGPPEPVRVIGVVDNSADQSYGLLASAQTFAPLESGLDAFAGEYYFFKLRPGADVRADALALGSALLNDGFETTVVQDALLDVNGPAVFASRVLVGLVGLTLLVGMAALAVTGTRAVVERRQQIGMLRALGYQRADVRHMFVLEAVFVAGLGVAIGLGLGLVLCRNVFAVSFFEQFQTGIVLVVPWGALAAICATAVLAALVAAFLPAHQAGAVLPAEALRYE
jgi:putative ABC transport system permease protein